MQGGSDLSTDTRDPDNQWEIKQKKEPNRPEGHPHLVTEKEETQHPDGEQSGCSPIAHRFTRVVRCGFIAALCDPEDLTENTSVVPSSYPQRNTSEGNPCARLLFEMIDVPRSERVRYNQLDATEKPEKPAGKREV